MTMSGDTEGTGDVKGEVAGRRITGDPGRDVSDAGGGGLSS
jgi:hypothetical protein